MPLYLPPEVINNIAAHLTHKDLTSSVVVNKDWFALYTPHLWTTFRITKHDMPFMSLQFRQAFSRNHRYIRHLQCKDSTPPIIQMFVINDLHLETISFRTTSDPLSPCAIESLISVLKKSAALQVLHINRGSRQLFRNKRLLETISNSLQELRVLDLFADSDQRIPPGNIKDFLKTCSAKLERLHIKVVVGVKGVRDMEGEGTKDYKSHPRLRTFSFIHVKDLVSNIDLASLATILLDFLKGCDSLEMVDDGLPAGASRLSWIYHCHQLDGALLPVLKTRHFRGLPAGHVPDYAMQDSTLAQEILRVVEHKDELKDNWRVIHLREELHPIPETSQALVEASGQGLRSLYTTVRNQLSSTVVQQILVKGRDLRMIGGSVLPELLVSDLLQSPMWSCKFLTVLMVSITGIPRPDVQVDYRDTPIAPGTPLHIGTMAESRRIQRAVFHRLGSLVCLRELVLGAEGKNEHLVLDCTGLTPVFYDTIFQSTCLEMTLESGLDLLSGLTFLRRLDVSNMEHRIGVKELEWLDWTLPGLTYLQGMRPRLPAVFGRQSSETGTVHDIRATPGMKTRVNLDNLLFYEAGFMY
ncbi:hypothetical protein BKA57DRAFT_472375 [Linnemannia elongata]|nr:hypothetical protein BKA57DRAFT_472375 [Linnemannia elongata]